MTTDPDLLRARLRADMTAAMKARDKMVVAVLRTASPRSTTPRRYPPAPAGRAAGEQRVRRRNQRGAGLAEVARRELTLDDLHTVLRAQIDEGLAEADTYTAHGRAEAGDRLRREAEVLRRYLG